jgi:glyoxylase-like metal-dependent hydrolase (beta-lactamase superfamily II)/rhodanese-related sulfurtransferase
MTDEENSDRDPADAPSVSPTELHDRIRGGERVRLLDVRNRDEFEAWRIGGTGVETTQVPYAEFVAAKARDEVADFVADLGLDRERPVVAVCPRGEASATVADLLRETGIEARNLDGGMQGWARVYVSREVPTDGGRAADSEAHDDETTVRQYHRPATGCLSYLVVSGDEAAVIDPLRAFTDRYAADAEEQDATLRWAIDTHIHADHLSGARRLADGTPESDARTGAGPDAEVRAVLPEGAKERGLAFDPHLLADGDELRVGETTLTALHAPGHTAGLTALRLGDLLFSGDALFVHSFGRPDLEQGEEGARKLAETLYDTLTERLLALPDETLVAPDHRTPNAEPNSEENGTFTARLDPVRERLRIPDKKDAFVARVLDSLPPRPANYEEIIPANLGLESVDDESAFEMELGPNNCAVGAENS